MASVCCSWGASWRKALALPAPCPRKTWCGGLRTTGFSLETTQIDALNPPTRADISDLMGRREDALDNAGCEEKVCMKIHRPSLLSALAFLGLALPWLNPFSPGPTPNVVPWLAALAGFAVMLPWLARARPAQVAALAASAWLLVALLSALLGLLQYFGATGALEPWVNSTGLGEAFANLRQRNQFATLTNIGLAALLWWRVQGQTATTGEGGMARSKPLAWRALAALAAAVLLALGNAASSSRTGLVQLVLLAAMVGW